MPTIYLPAGMAHVPCDDVALKIAYALCPDDGIDDEGWGVSFGCCLIKCEQEVEQAARNGTLPVKDPLTFAPLTFLRGNAWKFGEVDIDDLRAYVAGRRITVVVGDAPEKADTQPQAGNDAHGVTHSTKGTRTDALTPVIKHAQSQCENPDEVAQVWTQLEKLAGEKYGPLVQMTQGELTYSEGGEAQTITREAIHKRIKRAAANRR